MDIVARSLVPVDIEAELRSSYLDYSMSVIVGRALPDIRDGLKPVHRRILYAMFREGLLSSRRYSKCAGVVGEVLKKYHPHGDSAVYDALVRMAQPWNVRYPLVDGQGNFGSVDGDPPAAYRYTECRMTRLAEELLADIDKDTVNFQPNFDGQAEEPVVLPAAFPNLLVNGSDGIAVGMATKIPPHNLGEIIDAVIMLIDRPEATVDDLMTVVPGPDFPTGGAIHGRAGVREAYTTGRGRVLVRGRATFEEDEDGRVSIVIDELPYQVNKARLHEEIAACAREKRIEGISAARDESDRDGMRLVVELKRDAAATKDVVLNQLYKHTLLQQTFGVIMLAIVHGRPVVLDLKEALRHYLAHRRDVTARRTRHDLKKAQERQHVLEGFLIALANLDEVIALIRASADPEAARTGLQSRFGFSEIQAQAILDLRLQRLTAMERDKIDVEHRELGVRIGELQAILADDGKLMGVIRSELLAIRETYADARRTRFEESSADLEVEDLIPEEDQVVTLSVSGYVKRTSQAEFREQRRGGMGLKGMSTRDEDSVKDLFIANTHSDMLVFTRHGLVFSVRVWRVPEVGRDARGTPIVNLLQLESGDDVAAVLTIPEFTEDLDLLFCSKKGLVKRTRLSEYKNMRSSGLIAYKCAEGDELLNVALARTQQHVLIVTKDGQAIRFAGVNEKGELEVRHVGRGSQGVVGVRLVEGDEIAEMLVLEDDPAMRLLTVTENGYGKRTPLHEYPIRHRGGQGVINIDTGERNGRVVGSVQVHEDDRVMLITNTGRCIKIPVGGVRETGRNAKGVTLMQVDEGAGERVVGVARVVEQEEEAPNESGDDGPAPEGGNGGE